MHVKLHTYLPESRYICIQMYINLLVYTKLDMFRSDSQLSVISGSLLLNRNVTLLTGRSML